MDGETTRIAAEARPCNDAGASATAHADQESQPDGPGLENTLGPLALASALFWIGVLVLLL